MAVCPTILENDSSVLDLILDVFLNSIVATANSGTVEYFSTRYHHDGHHQRNDGTPHTPSPVRLHVHMQLSPKMGRWESRPTFGGQTGTLEG